MQLARTLFSARLGATLIAAALVGGCDDDPSGPSSSLTGTWNATSFVVQGQDLIILGMDLALTLTASDTYTLTVANDLTGVCGTNASCTETGAFTSTATSITLNPGTLDEVTFNYVVQGQTLTFTGSIDGNAATIVFTRE